MKDLSRVLCPITEKECSSFNCSMFIEDNDGICDGLGGHCGLTHIPRYDSNICKYLWKQEEYGGLKQPLYCSPECKYCMVDEMRDISPIEEMPEEFVAIYYCTFPEKHHFHESTEQN